MSGLYDHIGPSIIAEDLARVVRRLRKHTCMDVVPMLIVEGPTDESLLAPHCAKQVFAAGTRALVEQLLVHLRDQPIAGCDCVYLTDCDARGKSIALREERSLVVTTNCDMEADLVALGVAAKVLTEILPQDVAASEVVSAAIALAIPVSQVRRAAAQAGVTFKRSGGARLALRDMAPTMLRDGLKSGLSTNDVMAVVSQALGWSSADVSSVQGQLPTISADFRAVCSGKDVLDAAWIVLRSRGVAGSLTAEALHRRVRSGFTADHVVGWDVAQRLRAWQESVGLELLL